MDIWNSLKEGVSNISMQAKVTLILIFVGVLVFLLILYNWYQAIPPLVT